ncbi:TELO2-interacting protein 2-like [Prorops nasuta]|uniref:TELO2-interacting protein 2-like n=1 Tax=Prorops nasuta TaxID=863751 RepID=UPI0034CD7B56
MDNLLKELEALKINENVANEKLWTSCIELVQKTFVPQKNFGVDRPLVEKDFREYRQIIDRNLQNILSTLQHIHEYKEKCSESDFNAILVHTFAINIIALVGEHHEKNVWNTAESVLLSKQIILSCCSLFNCFNVDKFIQKDNNFNAVLLLLRPKLMKDTWKTYPAAVSCYKWLLHIVEKPILYDNMNDVLPTALIIIDDYVPENIFIGLECLHEIVRHSQMKKNFVSNGYAELIYQTLEKITYTREAKYIMPLYSCLTDLLTVIEYSDTNINVFEWTKRDDILATLLDNMEFEQNVELRHAYMSSVTPLLTNVGCAKWCERLSRILSEYCQHHTNLNTLKATLEAAKTFLHIFNLRVSEHCIPLYSAFLKLHIDLTETPVFDKQIIRNLETCISMLYKLTPDIGAMIIRDCRIQSIVKNNLQLECLGDSRYFF